MTKQDSSKTAEGEDPDVFLVQVDRLGDYFETWVNPLRSIERWVSYHVIRYEERV